MADFFPNRFGGAPRIGPGGGRALRRAGLPHLQAPKPPQINYGAVAQARTRPPAPAPLQSPFGRSMGPGLGTLAPTEHGPRLGHTRSYGASEPTGTQGDPPDQQ